MLGFNRNQDNNYKGFFKRLPDIPKDIIRLGFFIVVFLVMIFFGIASFSNIALWSVLTLMQVGLLIFHIRKQIKDNAEEEVDEETFEEQLKKFDEKVVENTKSQEIIDEKEYNEDNDEGFAEYDLSEIKGYKPVYTDEDGI